MRWVPTCGSNGPWTICEHQWGYNFELSSDCMWPVGKRRTKIIFGYLGTRLPQTDKCLFFCNSVNSCAQLPNLEFLLFRILVLFEFFETLVFLSSSSGIYKYIYKINILCGVLWVCIRVLFTSAVCRKLTVRGHGGS